MLSRSAPSGTLLQALSWHRRCMRSPRSKQAATHHRLLHAVAYNPPQQHAGPQLLQVDIGKVNLHQRSIHSWSGCSYLLLRCERPRTAVWTGSNARSHSCIVTGWRGEGELGRDCAPAQLRHCPAPACLVCCALTARPGLRHPCHLSIRVRLLNTVLAGAAWRGGWPGATWQQLLLGKGATAEHRCMQQWPLLLLRLLLLALTLHRLPLQLPLLLQLSVIPVSSICLHLPCRSAAACLALWVAENVGVPSRCNYGCPPGCLLVLLGWLLIRCLQRGGLTECIPGVYGSSCYAAGGLPKLTQDALPAADWLLLPLVADQLWRMIKSHRNGWLCTLQIERLQSWSGAHSMPVLLVLWGGILLQRCPSVKTCRSHCTV